MFTREIVPDGASFEELERLATDYPIEVIESFSLGLASLESPGEVLEALPWWLSRALEGLLEGLPVWLRLRFVLLCGYRLLPSLEAEFPSLRKTLGAFRSLLYGKETHTRCEALYEELREGLECEPAPNAPLPPQRVMREILALLLQAYDLGNLTESIREYITSPLSEEGSLPEAWWQYRRLKRYCEGRLPLMSQYEPGSFEELPAKLRRAPEEVLSSKAWLAFVTMRTQKTLPLKRRLVEEVFPLLLRERLGGLPPFLSARFALLCAVRALGLVKEELIPKSFLRDARRELYQNQDAHKHFFRVRRALSEEDYELAESDLHTDASTDLYQTLPARSTRGATKAFVLASLLSALSALQYAEDRALAVDFACRAASASLCAAFTAARDQEAIEVCLNERLWHWRRLVQYWYYYRRSR